MKIAAGVMGDEFYFSSDVSSNAKISICPLLKLTTFLLDQLYFVTVYLLISQC